MSRLTPILFFALFSCFSGTAGSQEIEQFVEVPPPPPKVTYDEDIEERESAEQEPEVTIIRRRDATHEEYRLNGRLYMVKITPKVGKPYFFIDRDGDGLMEKRMYDRGSKIEVPQWVIFSW